MAAPQGNSEKGNISGIYKILSPTGRIYIGQSVDIKTRFSKYRSMSCVGQRRLLASFIKHGLDSHIFEIIEMISDLSLLSERERFWQDYYDVIGENGLNCKLVTKNCHSGSHSHETRRLISIANTGKKASNEARIKMSKAKLGKKMPEHQRIAMIGRKLADTTKAKMRGRMMGNSNTKGMIPKNARKITCMYTGDIFPSILNAAKHLGIKRSTLGAMLSGQNPNKTSLRYM